MIKNRDGFLYLSNKMAECAISLWGANIVSYRPKNEEHDVFWLGERNKFDNVQAIRGGVPVCWPRFAEEKLNDRFPRHGFARLSLWALKNAYVSEEEIKTELVLVPSAEYDLKLSVRLLIRITDKLEYCLETQNNSDEIFEFSEALHAYFNVGSLDEIKITGLSGHVYRSSLDGKTYTLNKDLKIDGEFDAAFQKHYGTVKIIDPVFERVIAIEKTGSETTVVWNPNKDLAEMSEGQCKNFVCVEPANQGEAFVRLEPRDTHQIAMTVKILPFTKI